MTATCGSSWSDTGERPAVPVALRRRVAAEAGSALQAGAGPAFGAGAARVALRPDLPRGSA